MARASEHIANEHGRPSAAMQSCSCCMFEGNAEALKRLALLNPLCMESEEDGGGGKERTTGKRTTAGGGKSVQGRVGRVCAV